jgi:hypothetical protein
VTSFQLSSKVVVRPDINIFLDCACIGLNGFDSIILCSHIIVCPEAVVFYRLNGFFA